MSDVERLKEQLHHVATESNQAVQSLGGFGQKFQQNVSQVEALIAGTATGADREITQLLDAAGKAINEAVQALQVAAQSCRTYAERI